MQATNTGWRQAALTSDTPYPPHTDQKSDLFEAARLCGRVLDLPSSCRFVLDQLCAAYGGELIQGRIIVWPSNSYLESRTGIKERTIRFALRRLIDLGVISAKDSPNGKRYARKDGLGNVTVAYGFDLSPLLHRLSELRDRLVALQDRERDRRQAFDELTIARRNAQEALHRLIDEFPSTDVADLERRVLTLSKALPRRSSKVVPIDALRLWKTLYNELRTRLIAASGGGNCRHKDTNKNPPQISCYKRSEEDKAAETAQGCPDAVQILGSFRHDGEMFDHAERYRGMLGVSNDAWTEARQQLGDEDAARLIYLVTQIQAKPSEGAAQIRNFGGYFRAMMRKIAEGAIDLDTEINRRT